MDLMSGFHTLIKKIFFAYTNDNSFIDTDLWKLSDMAKKELLPKLNAKKNKYETLNNIDTSKRIGFAV